MRQPTVIRQKVAPTRGVLRTSAGDPGRSRHRRYHPSPDLAELVEHYWSVEWDFRGRAPERVEILPHPCVHLTFDRHDGARVMGVTRGKFTRELSGQGGVFGVKFTPAGFYPFLGAPVSRVTDTSVGLRAVFGSAGDTLARAIRASRTDASRIALVEAFLRNCNPRPERTVVRVSALVFAAANDGTILRVEDLAARAGMTPRTLQRLFVKYVGVTPKWVIRRYRLHEAAERLAGGAVGQAALALSLGYSDQAHFIRDFKAVVGTSPAAYARKSWQDNGLRA
jgi:AraC-like DNA-binding protein